MSSFSKRIKINPDVLLEYVYDDTNYQARDYQVLTNLKETSKSYMSELGLNTKDNSLLLIDPVLSKYSKVDTDNFNFLRIQNYSSALTLYDTVKLYFPSGFDFYDDYEGFYINIYVHGYENNKKYSLTNFYYTKDNTDAINLFTLNRPFLFDSKYWVRSIELEIPSPHYVSGQRVVTNAVNEPTPNTINEELTYGEGISPSSPIFVDFGFISSKQSVLGVDYFYVGDLASFSVPQTPEFSEVGVVVQESTQGDYFEIFSTYMGSNENMDEFAYNEDIKGNPIELQYIVKLYEENILTTNQTYEVTENFTQKILYRPIIQFSNTTAAIDVELRIVNKVDGSYVSKFGSVGIVNNINKYGRTLTRINLADGIVNSEIFNVKFKNVMDNNGIGVVDNTLDLVKIPYPVMVDKYRILVKSLNAAPSTSDYVPNGLLEIIVTSFDTIINFNIAQDINADGQAVPYDLSTINNNSKLLLTFKSDTERVEKEILYDADNNFEIGNIYYKIEEDDYKVIKRIYNKGYDNFYLVVSSDSSSTQLYSGKYVFYEDLTFVSEEDGEKASGTTESVATNESVANTENLGDPTYKTAKVVEQNDAFKQDNMDAYSEDTKSDKNYYNVLVYVRFQTNMDKLDEFLAKNGITPKVKYANMYFLERVYATMAQKIKTLDYVEKVFELDLTTGQAPKKVKTKESALSSQEKAKMVYRQAPSKKTEPKKPYTPPKPNVVLERTIRNRVMIDEFDNTFTNTSANEEAMQVDYRRNRPRKM